MFNIDNILFLPALTGPIFLIVGLIMYYFPPKNINYLYGYRTNSSMKSQETWNFSQKYAAVQMIKMAIILVVVSLFFSFIKTSETSNLSIGTIVLLSGVAFVLYKVEKAIKINFPNL